MVEMQKEVQSVWMGMNLQKKKIFFVFFAMHHHQSLSRVKFSFSPDIRNSKHVKKIPETLFQLNVEEVNFLAKEEHTPRLHPWNKNTLHKT